MKTIHDSLLLNFRTIGQMTGFALLAGLCFGLGAGSVPAATVVWTHGGTDWNWNNRTNWSTFTVPVAGDDVYITNNASSAINIDADATLGFGSLTVGGSSGTIAITWNPSWLKGAIILGPGAVMNIVGDYNGHFLSGVITNYGRINWQAGAWIFDDFSRLENMPGALVDVTCDATMGAGGGVVNNAGTFRKSAGGGTVAISPTPAIAFNNSGLLEVLSGTLEMHGSGTNSGTAHIAENAVLALKNGTYVFAPGHTFSGSGVCSFGANVCNIKGTLNGSTVTFRMDYDVDFEAELVNGTMIWNYGPGNQTGNLTIRPNAVYNVGSGCLIQGSMTNYGHIIWPPGGRQSWDWVAGSRLENKVGGVIDLQTDARFYSGAGLQTFNNEGTLLKSGGTNQASIDGGISFNNTGFISVSSGSLVLNGMSSSGTIYVGTGAAVVLNSGAFDFLPGHAFTGAGTWRIEPFAGSVAINGPLNGTPTFLVDGGVVFNSRLDTTLWWTNGTLAGNLTVGTNAVVNFMDVNTLSGTVTNYGRMNWLPGSRPWYWNDTARLENRPGGVVDFQGDFGFDLPATAVWNNAGTILKSGGLSDSHLYTRLALTNTGLMDFKKGNCALVDGLSSTGAINIAAGASLRLEGGTFVFGPAHKFTGTGGLDFGASSLSLGGPLAGTVTFTMVYDTTFTNCTLAGAMDWSRGNLRGALSIGSGGILNLLNAGSLGGVITNYGQIRWPTNGAGSWSWDAGAVLYNQAGGIFHVEASNDRSFYPGGTAFTFSNIGTFRKSGPGTLAFYQAFAFANQGTVEALGGVLQFAGPFTQASGMTRLAGGSLQPDKGMNLAGGVLTGSGTVYGNVTNMAALVGPGEPLGTINVTGDYIQGAGGTFEVTIGGRNAGQFDVLTVGGSATLNGTLAMGFTNGFPPAIGDRFQVLGCASRSGVFSLTNAPAGLAPAYSNNAVYLDVTANIPVSSMLTSVEMSGGNFGFSFLTATGQSYSVLTNKQVNGTGWAVYTNFNGNGSTAQILAPPNMPQCFFQVRQP